MELPKENEYFSNALSLLALLLQTLTDTVYRLARHDAGP